MTLCFFWWGASLYIIVKNDYRQFCTLYHVIISYSKNLSIGFVLFFMGSLLLTKSFSMLFGSSYCCFQGYILPITRDVHKADTALICMPMPVRATLEYFKGSMEIPQWILALWNLDWCQYLTLSTVLSHKISLANIWICHLISKYIHIR